MTRLQVPQWLKAVFDTFPLTTYDAVEVGDQADVAKNQYFFLSSEPEKSPDHNFILGVDNVIEIGDKIVPSTPLALFHALVLCHKNNLRLPNPNGNKTKSQHSIFTISFLASSTNELPIMIETNERIQTRDIIPKKALLNSIVTKNFESDTRAKLIFNMIVQYVQDLWILTLLCDKAVDNSVLSRIFMQHQPENGVKTAEHFQAIALKDQIPDWNDFKVRNPNLFLSGWSFGDNGSALDQAYDDKLAQFKRELPNIIKTVSGADSCTNFIKLQVAAFVVLVTELLPNTKLYDVLNQDKSFVKVAYDTVDKY